MLDGADAAAAAAVAAATAVLIARGIRILNGDLVGFEADGANVVDPESSTLVGVLGEAGGFEGFGGSAVDCEVRLARVGDDAADRTALRASNEEEAGEAADGANVLGPAAGRDALVARVGVEVIVGSIFDRGSGEEAVDTADRAALDRVTLVLAVSEGSLDDFRRELADAGVERAILRACVVVDFGVWASLARGITLGGDSGRSS
jgi:hypothetical protein